MTQKVAGRAIKNYPRQLETLRELKYLKLLEDDMPSNAIDLAILISLECCFDALFPNFPKKERFEKISMARDFLSSSKISFEEVIKDPKKGRLLENKIRNSMCSNFDNVAKRTIERYFKRLEKGFIISIEKNDLSEKIINVGRRIESLSDDLIYAEDIISLVIEMTEKSKTDYYETGIHDEIIGAASDPRDEWDKRILEIHDEEYDQGYIETIALRLKNPYKNLNFLYSWKKSVNAKSYEILRDFLKINVLGEDIEEIILPY
ncbi:hypothetical protein [Paracidovorax cattleyae]|uniref:Uncharacterized protein n=1 Tax=Paracidovorax cattleyae TaxID=80868 RepID=A0A1H0WMZ3_9BURK|nr:hypothetical protein [Paracidovorax cattleyae]SDP92100.1 hypothetical protein SAMN04489708_14427 [Paracidovorax cattleyae]